MSTTMSLTIYGARDGGDRIIAPDNEAGRLLASEVLGGSRGDADEAEIMGMVPDPLTRDQRHHLRRHGWAPTA